MKAVFTGSRIIGEHWFLNLPGVAWRLKVGPDRAAAVLAVILTGNATVSLTD